MFLKCAITAPVSYTHLRTKEIALRAFGTLHPKWKFFVYLSFLVPMLIMTYYSVIGGWITKYFFEYLKTSGRDVAEDGYFTSFITEKNAPLIFTGIFLALTLWIVYRGVAVSYTHLDVYKRHLLLYHFQASLAIFLVSGYNFRRYFNR